MKTYIQPETKVVKVKTVQMMAVSTLGIDSTPANKVTNVGDLLGREDNSWDIWGTGDDDEE